MCRYSLHLNLLAVGEECILNPIRDSRGAVLTRLYQNDRTNFCKYLAMATGTFLPVRHRFDLYVSALYQDACAQFS
ncbi:MAG: hypothetical protein WAZ77_17295, partial [Candidatus Nitrosopolaris sp.]